MKRNTQHLTQVASQTWQRVAFVMQFPWILKANVCSRAFPQLFRFTTRLVFAPSQAVFVRLVRILK